MANDCSTSKIESLQGLASIPASDIEVPAEVLNAAPDMISIFRLRKRRGTCGPKRRPTYPAEAKRIGAQGTVVLEGVIGKDGRLQDLKPVISPHPTLTEAALVAVKEMGI